MKWIKSQLISVSFFALKLISFIPIALLIGLIQLFIMERLKLSSVIAFGVLIVSGLFGFYLLAEVWGLIDKKKAKFIKNQTTKEIEDNELTSVRKINYKQTLINFILRSRNKLLGERLEKFEKKEKYKQNSRLKWLNWILNRKKGVTLSIILIPILKLFTHYFLYTSGRYKTTGHRLLRKRKYIDHTFSYHIDNLFVEEIWLFIPVIIVFLALVWFFNDKKDKIEVDKEEEIENTDEITEGKTSEKYNSIVDELTKLNELKEKGLLTEEEFNEQKKKLLKQ